MDVDKLQRINALASELRKHNFALSSDDAFRQAEQVYVDGEHAPLQTVQVPAPVKDNALEERKIQLILDMNNKKFQQEFDLLRSALNTLAAELEMIKNELRKVSEQAPPKPKERQEPLKTETKEDHPRQGKFTSSDVDIQKMFYFGTKH